jgi:RNA-directed DNA polymerase
MNVSTKQQRIAELAKQKPQVSFTSLNHYLDTDWLQEAYRRLRKDSAPGCDNQTVQDYGELLESNLQSLLYRAKSGRYIAPPVKRVRIPKEPGKGTRPIGIPTTEDKLLERAVTMLLEPIYEQDFLDCSYGFRPHRSAHGALDALWHQCSSLGIKWILDVDIQKFFDTLDHAHLREFLRKRVSDGVITRLVDKWLKAGVLDQGIRYYPEEGTPQGGSISPLLSNIYLHYVLDLWFAEEVKPYLKGKAFMIRFADDVTMGFQCTEDVEKVKELLSQQLRRYGLSLHPEKTCIVPFARPRGTGGSKPGTFDFLGFTHYWGKSRLGKWVVKRKTARSRFSRGLKRIGEWCRDNRHKPVAEQHGILRSKLQGHYAYYGITGNGPWLQRFRNQALRIWCKWLNRRSWAGSMPWDRFHRLLNRYVFPPARVIHSIYSAKP